MADGKTGAATIGLHGGAGERVVGEPATHGPVLATSYFTHPDAAGFSATELKADAPHFYTRWSNPTIDLLEKRLALLEGAEAAVAFASGMAAITALWQDRLAAGDHLVISNVCYAGAAEYAQSALPRMGIEVTTADTSDLEVVAAAMRPNTKLVHVETPANPILRLSDIKAIAALAHQHGAELAVDSTIATPLGQQPLSLGADYVIHSLTKYICGHGDALGGAVLGRSSDMARLRKDGLIHLGGTLSPFAAYMILRGMETLELRMARHAANAAKVDNFLATHPKVRRVLWPGSPRHPQAALFAEQMQSGSGLLSFSLQSGSAEMARAFAEQLQVVSYAVSLGKTKSLMFFIPTDDILGQSFHLSGKAAADYREWAGDGVFRLSVGIEDGEDIVADLARVLG